MKNEFHYNLKKVILSGLFLVVSVVLLIGSSVAWFSSRKSVKATGGTIEIATFEIESVRCTFYRSDGFRYELNTGVCYDNANAPQTEMVFSMLEYDTIITEKNEINNLILRTEIKFAQGVKSTILAAGISTLFTDAFAGDADGVYHLSDVLKISKLSALDLGTVTTNREIYTAATTAFGPVAESDKQKFVSIESETAVVKNSVITFKDSVPADSDTLVLWFNLEYDEPLVKRLYGGGYGQFEWGGKDRMPLKSDLSFSFDTEGSEHA